ncbi:hypothetical protein [Hymenobacter arizonensis]|uniref:Lipocalin-like domain-containing protein n=1 Tax=Hymenobacter arizonensis TaxID=1227077 RepID=A0A1I5ZN33_HYMAR|nr:hypothetical protein [Hymenobacter arizonensis]SFQ57862.1 hypothetical protein SAMN04515668_3053 [Hymenobacter arizonensis]
MKPFLLFPLVLAAAVACHQEGPAPAAPEAAAAPYPQTWRLVKLTGSIPGAKTGANLPFQETVLFRADSTFLKTRLQGDQYTEARGTFSRQNGADGRRYVLLAYAVAGPLVRSCVANASTEGLAFEGNETLISSTQACDGARLEYQSVK